MRQMAQRVYDFLCANPNVLFSGQEVADALDLTYSQVVYAVYLSRRHFRPAIPICTIYGRGGGYVISNQDGRVRPYRGGVMRTVRSMIEGFRANMLEHLTTQAAGTDQQEAQAARLVLLQTERLIEDIGLLVPANGAP